MGIKETGRNIRKKQLQFAQARGRLTDKLYERQHQFAEARQDLKTRFLGIPSSELPWGEPSILPAGTKVDLQVHLQQVDQATKKVDRKIEDVTSVRLTRDQLVRPKGPTFFEPYSEELQSAQAEAHNAADNYRRYVESTQVLGDTRDDIFELEELKRAYAGKDFVAVLIHSAVLQDFIRSVPEEELSFDRNDIIHITISRVGRIWPHRSSERAPSPREGWRDRLRKWETKLAKHPSQVNEPREER